MKKQLQTGLILSVIFLSTNTFAQTSALGSAKIKDDKKTEKTYLSFLLNVVSTNLNYGKSSIALTDNKKSVQGVQIGASFQAGITSNLSLVSELYFIMKGGRLKEDKLSNINKTTLRFYTAEFPLLARLDLGRVYLNAGPSIAYNISGTNKVDNYSKAIAFNNSTEGFKRWDAGVQMGAGYRFKIKQKSVALDVRYAYGLTNISYGQEMHNRYINIGLYATRPWRSNPFGKKRG